MTAGQMPDPETGHWASRVASGPNEGLLLKGRKHETWDKLEAGERESGYEIYKKNGRYWSRKKKGNE